jgi:HAE1 family hydrophobic/amphiphilic exporter-1
MNLIESFIQNPIKVAVGVLLIGLFGVIALLRMPMQLTPEVQTPTLTIETVWPGASPQEVEREIIHEQEEQLKSVEGITKMSSEAMDSMGRITLEFLVGTNMEESLLKVNTRLQQVREYPEEADQPIISTSNASDRPIAWFILGNKSPDKKQLEAFIAKYPNLAEILAPAIDTPNTAILLLRLRNMAKDHPEVKELLPPDVDISKMRRFCEDVIEARFERVSGVSNANVMGGREEELQVIVDPQRLAARNLTINDVRQVLRGGNQDTSGGDFWEGKRRYVVRTLGQYRSEEDVAAQILKSENGAIVTVADVADVELGYKKPDGFVRRFGSTNVAINALRETGANVLDVMGGLRRANEELNRDYLYPRGLELTQVYDETEYIYAAVDLVNSNIVIGGLLTVAVLLVFLRSGRSTLIIAISIPTSLIGTFLILNLLGRSLNVISLAGLSFAVGMLVDNAVVVLENIYRHWQEGEDPVKAATRGTQEVWGAVIASTLTTLAVFLPVLFVQQEAGQLFRDIALAISAAVGLSLIVAVTLIPVLASRLFAGAEKEESPEEENPLAEASDARSTMHLVGDSDSELATAPTHPRLHELKQGPIARSFAFLDRFGGWFVDRTVAINLWLLHGVLRRLIFTFGLLGLTFFLSYVLWPKVEYLPTGNRNLTMGIILPPPGYNLDELVGLGESAEATLRPYWDVDPNSEKAKNLPYPPIGDFFFVARGRQVFMGIRAADAQKAGNLVPLVQSVGANMPGTFMVAKQSSLFEQGLTGGRTIDVEITGPELRKLVGFGGMILGKAKQLIPDAQLRPVPSLDLSSPEVHILPKSEQMADNTFNATELGYTVDALVDGAYASDYYVGGDKIDLTIVGQQKYADQTHSLESLAVATPAGKVVTLGDLASIELSSGPEQVNHRERQRAITIEISPPPHMALEDAITLINTEIIEPMRKSGQLEGGYMIGLSGTADKLNETWDALRWNVVLALLITYLLMAALFESWLYPLVIIFSVPLGAVGGIIGLQLLSLYLVAIGQPPQMLDVLTMLGFVILIGTVVNNPILIVHQSLNHMREDHMTARDAILESVSTRIRPIFVTTTTTVLGLAPLVLMPGSGSELYRGLGAVVLGGLVVSTLFTLVFVPVLFSLMMETKDALLKKFRRRSRPKTSPKVSPVQHEFENDEMELPAAMRQLS